MLRGKAWVDLEVDYPGWVDSWLQNLSCPSHGTSLVEKPDVLLPASTGQDRARS